MASLISSFGLNMRSFRISFNTYQRVKPQMNFYMANEMDETIAPGDAP
jgi:hypothetical protein